MSTTSTLDLTNPTTMCESLASILLDEHPEYVGYVRDQALSLYKSGDITKAKYDSFIAKIEAL